jgi:lysophospholipase L1-like esterase
MQQNKSGFFSSIKKTQVAYVFMVLLGIAYLCWEAYWYHRVGLRFIQWHTHLAPYIFCLILIAPFAGMAFSNNKYKGIQNYVLMLLSIVLSLALVETILVVSGWKKNYIEEVSGFYSSPYVPQENGYYHTWTPGKAHWLIKPEYRFVRPTNSLGLADSEWVKAKPKGKKRILCLGDSFTEGDGAAYDSSYVSCLKRSVLHHDSSYEVMNAGVCGSDPCYDFMQLKGHLLEYQPDLILQTISTNDLSTDFLLRGGLERFQKNGSVKYRDAPRFEPIYACSYVSRFVFQLLNYNELLVKKQLSKTDELRINDEMMALIDSYAACCKQQNIKLIFILRTEKLELHEGKYELDFSKIKNDIESKNHLTLIDLMPAYQQHFQKSGEKMEAFYWEKDGHHNAHGYQLMADIIYDAIKPILLDSAKKEDLK